MGRGGQRAAGPDGVAVVDKEADWTSHDVVAKSRGILGTRKVGHSGTLDPDATGRWSWGSDGPPGAVSAGVTPRLAPVHIAISPTSVTPSWRMNSGRNGITSVKPV